MELAMHNWMRAESIETTIRRASKLGYHKLEIAPMPEVYTTKEVRKLLMDYHMRCWGSVTLMLGERNLLTRDEAQREKSIQYAKDVVKFAKELDGEMITIIPGTVGKTEPEGRPQEEWEWAVQSMKEINAYAQASGILLALEPINRFEAYLINRADQALALADAIGPNCGICLDTFHMNIEEDDMFAAMRRTKGRLVNFHVSDNNRMAPGMGKLDWPKIIETLHEIGYDKVLSVEFCSPLDRTPANPYPNSIDENPEGLTPDQKKFLEKHGSSSVTDEFYTMLTRKSAEILSALLQQKQMYK
jgi:sugar phosphate isomerase/epimerase